MFADPRITGDDLPEKDQGEQFRLLFLPNFSPVIVCKCMI